MKNLRIFTLTGLITIVSLILTACATATKEAKPVFLTIAAGSSLKDAMLDIQKVYSKEKPNVTISYNFAPSGLNREKIEQGETADIFFSGAAKHMDVLDSKGFVVSSSRKNILSDRILLVAPKNAKAISDFKDLTGKQIKKLALAKPETAPSGKYGQQVLTSLGIFDKVKDKIVWAEDSEEAINYLETGKADAGIVFATKAILSNKIKFVAIAPENSHSPIVYTIAVLKSSNNIPESMEFIEFLESDRAEAVFMKYRFTVNIHTSSK